MAQAIGIYIKYHGFDEVLSCSQKPQWKQMIKALYPRQAIASILAAKKATKDNSIKDGGHSSWFLPPTPTVFV